MTTEFVQHRTINEQQGKITNRRLKTHICQLTMNTSVTRMFFHTTKTCLRHKHSSAVKFSWSMTKALNQRLLIEQCRIRQFNSPHTVSCTLNLHTSSHTYQKNTNQQEGPQKNFILRNWYSVMAAVTLLGGGFYFYSLRSYKENLKIQKALEVSEEVGEAKIAVDDWELVDINGKKVTNRDLLGKWCIFYFGFTHCPDICPDELDKLAATAKILEVNTSIPNIEVVFVSVDPERDTPEVIKEYLSDFSRKFIGLTGTLEEVKKAGRAYRVYFSKGKMDEDGDYIVDHSIITYLINPKGKFVEFYSRAATAMEIANRVEKKMKEYSLNN